MGREGKTISLKVRQKGFTLVEILIAIGALGVVGTGTVALYGTAKIASMRAKETVTANRYMQFAFSRLKNIDFYQLFNADSRQANTGLQSSHPYRAVYQEINDLLRSSKFDYYTMEVTFLRRDSSDANGNGLTSDLIAFRDTNNDLRDDYDPNIRYFDSNIDGDYFDTYISNGRVVAEQPDTHLKQVTVKFYKQTRLVLQQTQLVSLEQFSGIESPSSEASLKLLVSTPTNSSYLYAADTPQRIDALNLVITRPYPSEINRYRADQFFPMVISGETDPLSWVRFFLNGSNELANTQADMLGNFGSSPLIVTQRLVEGSNQLQARATKDTFSSPIAPRDILLDLKAPQVSLMTPQGTVATYTPYVAATIADTPVNPGADVSGIVADVITLRINSQIVNHRYDATTQTVVWVDSTTGLVPVLSSGYYTATVELGDYAGYKVANSWSFNVYIQDPDSSPPSIVQQSPMGTTQSLMPEISARIFDEQSGIMPSSIILTLDGQVVVNASNVSLYYDPSSDFVRYSSTTPFVNGTNHTVELTVRHWANNPPDRTTSTDNWSFFVNAP